MDPVLCESRGLRASDPSDLRKAGAPIPYPFNNMNQLHKQNSYEKDSLRRTGMVSNHVPYTSMSCFCRHLVLKK